MQVDAPLVHGVDTLAVKDVQTVTQAGVRVESRVEGAEFRPAAAQADERGVLTEVFSVGWGFTDAAVVHVYEVSLRPGQIRGGWVVHLEQDDRLFFSNGCARVALFDAREGSPTQGLVDVRFLGAHDRGLLVIPAGVYHAVRNVGETEMTFINLPTQVYDHTDPDKYRLPLDNELIPFRP